MMRMLGYDSREELLQHRSTDFFADPEFRNELLRLLQERRHRPGQGGRPADERTGPSCTRFGAGVLLVDEQTGEPYIQGVALDITERKKAEEALRELTADAGDQGGPADRRIEAQSQTTPEADA